MPIDYGKLTSMDYTVYEHVQDFQRKLKKRDITYPVLEVEKNYEDNIPVVEIKAEDHVYGTFYTDQHRLENITKEEFEEVMFDIWREALEDIEQY